MLTDLPKTPDGSITHPRSMANFYQNFVKDDKNLNVSLFNDGKYMFDIASNNFFSVDISFESWFAVGLKDVTQAVKKPLFALGAFDQNREGRIYVTDSYLDNFGKLVQEVSLPSFYNSGAQEIEQTQYGKLHIPPNEELTTDSYELSIKFLNTEYSIFEYMLEPWMREVSSKEWVYPNVPFSRADITVTFYNQLNKHRLHSYTYHDCYPTMFSTLTVTQENTSDITRDATFAFEWASIKLYDANAEARNEIIV